LKFHIPELKAVINEIQKGGAIGCIKYRSAELNLNRSFEFICRQLIGEVNQDITVYPFSVIKDMVRPDCIIHKLEKVFLHTLKNLAVRSLDPLSRYLYIAVQLLGINDNR
jgi:hypothetical protein